MHALLQTVVAIAAIGTATPVGPPSGEPQGADAGRRVVATLQLAAQEYRLAFVGGALVNLAEAEEAVLFTAAARGAARGLPEPLATDIGRRIDVMAALLARHGAADSLAMMAGDVERRLTTALGIVLDDRPAREPSMANGEMLFAATCARCHGMGGNGNGPAALAGRMNPPPTNLTDRELMAGAMPLDLFRKISIGVPGTRMPAYEDALSREERWDVVSYVLALSDSTARSARSGQAAVVFGTVRGALHGAVDLAARGEHDAAALKVLDAYMAYEAVEGALSATAPSVVTRTEAAFFALRTAAGSDRGQAGVRSAYADLLAALEASERALTESHSRAGLFVKSLLLILREGFEAILVIGAIMAVLLKAGATERRRHVRRGVLAAVVASVATAALFEWVLRVTPAQREALEGGVMLVAAATLFYVSYWLVSKIEVAAWQRFVTGRIQKAVVSGSATALAGAAFLAVYREGVETVLFYKALFLSGGAGNEAPIVIGMLAGGVLLLGLFVAIERFGIKIPMRPFFAVTSATLLLMSFTFAGTGMKELQEGAYVSISPIPGGPRSELLGIYPTWESVAVQLVILLAVAVALAWTFVIRPRRVAAREAAEDARAEVDTVAAPEARQRQRTTVARRKVGV